MEYVNTLSQSVPCMRGLHEVGIKTLQKVTIDMQMARAGVKSGQGGLLEIQ